VYETKKLSSVRWKHNECKVKDTMTHEATNPSSFFFGFG